MSLLELGPALQEVVLEIIDAFEHKAKDSSESKTIKKIISG